MSAKVYLNNEQADFWGDFQESTGEPGFPRGVDAFGDSEALKDELLALVLIGRKQATAGLARWFDGDPDGPPKPGDLWIITDGRDQPACVIRTVKVDIQPITEVSEEFAYIEGEGDRSLDWWLDAHRAYFEREAAREGFVYTEDMDLICEQFELVWQ